MSAAKQSAHDSFSVFLRNVKKKGEKSKIEPLSRTVSLEILKELNEHGPMSVHSIAENLDTTTVKTLLLLNKLNEAEMVEIDPNTEIVTATKTGQSAINLQVLFERSVENV